MATLYLNSIKCYEQEDHWGDDDAYIRVNGRKVWGTKKMDDGQTRQINKSVGFDSKAEIVLWEKDDADPDDKLGVQTLRQDDLGERRQRRLSEPLGERLLGDRPADSPVAVLKRMDALEVEVRRPGAGQRGQRLRP